MLLWLLACTQANQDTAQPEWIDITAFRSASLDDDLFPQHQPETIDCPPNGFRVEVNQLEIQTDICNYAIVEWITQRDVPADTTFEALILHTGLWSIESATAHFALSINGERQLFWEESPPIPSSTEFFFYEASYSNRFRRVPQSIYTCTITVQTTGRLDTSSP